MIPDPTPLQRRSTTGRLPTAGMGAAAVTLILTACTAPGAPPVASTLDWAAVGEEARGQTVSMWMYGGDEQGNRYVDTVLAPAAAAEGVRSGACR